MKPIFYFGCIHRAGHFWFRNDREHLRRDEESGSPYGPKGRPWPYVDGNLAPRIPLPGERTKTQEAPEGVASLTHASINSVGWTALSFWDRSVDKRGGCNSTFIVEEILTFDEIVARARAAYPLVWARYPFPVVEFVK